MAAPALSSSIPPPQRLVSQFIDGSIVCRPFQPSVQEAELLTITPEYLQKNGLNTKPWITYLETVVYPKLKQQAVKCFQNADPKKKAGILETQRSFNLCFQALINQLVALSCDSKTWKNYISGLIEATELVVKLSVDVKTSHLSETDGLNFFSRMTLAGEGPEESESVILHLQHLFLDRLSQELNPNDDLSFVIEKTVKPWLAVKQGEVWQFKTMLNPELKSLKYVSWPASNSLLPNHAVLIEGSTILRDIPFIGVSLRADKTSHELNAAIQNRSTIKKEDIPKLSYTTETIYCIGNHSNREVGNAVSFSGIFGLSTPNQVMPVSFEPAAQTLWNYARLATDMIRSAWFEEIQSCPIENQDHIRIHTLIFPKTPNEVNERIIATLELALEAPEKNALLIDWIAGQCDFEYTREELKQAEQLAGIVQEVEHKDAEEEIATPAVIAHAIIQKIKKQSAAQKPKQHSIKAEKSHYSHKQPVISKEELREQLSTSSMSPKLKEQAMGLLSGERLKSKREEDKFFLEILSYQAKLSGSSVKKLNSGGSHHSIKLVRQENASGKTTYRAATFVNKHGSDASRGHSLNAQQNNLQQLFTPLR